MSGALTILGNAPNRRLILTSLAVLLAGCATADRYVKTAPEVVTNPIDSQYREMIDAGRRIPAIDAYEIDPGLLRARVIYKTQNRPGTVVVDIAARHLYLVQAGGQALRYAIGVGREDALNFHGNAVIGRKEVWPSWTPTARMIERIPRYAAYSSGMSGGIDNPLGARALYLYRDGKDTEFRIHGTNEPVSIGTAVSSGCIRLFNHDIIDLYARVPTGAPVVVTQQS
jgi:lipoprotein-anchoring transpeptidase ErfK/SrfK